MNSVDGSFRVKKKSERRDVSLAGLCVQCSKSPVSHIDPSLLSSTLLLASPILATPVDLEARAGGTVRCTAVDTGKKSKHPSKSWTVNVDDAKNLVQRAGVEGRDTTGYPHAFLNADKFEWDPAACKKTNVDLLEYPVFWRGARQINPDRKINEQAHTPIRVVYANSGGTPVYCGVMIHSEVRQEQDDNRSWIGTGGFNKCT